MFISNSASLMPNHLAAGFQPARNIMKMVNTINNKLAAARTDSFTKSTEMEERVRAMMLEEEEAKVEQPAPMEFNLILQNPIEARTKTINIATLHVTHAKEWTMLMKKHEAIIADENSTDEERENSIKMSQQLKGYVGSFLGPTIEAHSALSNVMGRISDMRSGSNNFANVVKLTGDLSAQGLGLTGLESMSSDQILEKLDGALAHLNEMGKLLNPGYTPPAIEPLSQEELNRFERMADQWDYITRKAINGTFKDPLEPSTFSVKI